MPSITFIVPVYNASESFLTRCFESIHNQTDQDFEAIIVDDGSTNGCDVFCDSYAADKDNFHVYHKKNGRVASARNYGLGHATGDWIVFVDNDDAVATKLVESLKPHLHNPSLNMIYYDLLCYEGNKNTHQIASLPFPADKVLTADDVQTIILDIVADGYHSSSVNMGFLEVWCKAFRRTFIEQFHLRSFEDMTIADDLVFVLNSLLCNDKDILYIHQPYYLRYVFEESDSNSYHPEITKNDTIFLSHLQEVLQHTQLTKDLKAALNKRYVTCLIGMFYYDMCHKDNPKSKSTRIQEMKELSRKNPYKQGIQNCDLKLFSKKRRIFILLIRFHMEKLVYRLLTK